MRGWPPRASRAGIGTGALARTTVPRPAPPPSPCCPPRPIRAYSLGICPLCPNQNAEELQNLVCSGRDLPCGRALSRNAAQFSSALKEEGALGSFTGT